MSGRPHVDWPSALAYYLSLDRWEPAEYRRRFGERPDYRGLRALGLVPPPSERRTYANVARRFGVSRQAVSAAARRLGWPRHSAGVDERLVDVWIGGGEQGGDGRSSWIAEGLRDAVEALQAEWGLDDDPPPSA